MQIIFKILKRTDHLVCCRLDTLENVYLLICKNDGIVLIVNLDYRELLDISTYSFQIMTCTASEGCWNTERHNNSCDSRMNTRIQHEVPQYKTYSDIKCL